MREFARSGIYNPEGQAIHVRNAQEVGDLRTVLMRFESFALRREEGLDWVILEGPDINGPYTNGSILTLLLDNCNLDLLKTLKEGEHLQKIVSNRAAVLIDDDGPIVPVAALLKNDQILYKSPGLKSNLR